MNTPNALVPSTAQGIAAALPRWKHVAETSEDPEELRGVRAVAGGAKTTAKTLGIGELHAELSWIEETALRRAALMERPTGAAAHRKPNETLDLHSDAENMRLSRARARHRDVPDSEFERVRSESLATNTPARPHVFHNSGENEWYTPAPIIAAARACMGGIDLDPASSDIAQRAVKADHHFTIRDDGLKQSWHGRVWMNPPYERGLVDKFVEKLLAEGTEQACVLTNNATETGWAQRLLAGAGSVCFLSGRVRYVSPDGVKNTPLQGQMVCGLGVSAERFSESFGPLGVVR